LKSSSIAQQAIAIKNDALKVGFTEDRADALAMAFINSHSNASMESDTSYKEQPTIKKSEFGSPTQLGKLLYSEGYSSEELTPRDVNKLLARLGLQTKCSSGTGWEPTKNGKLLSKVAFMTTEVKGEVHRGSMNIRWDLEDTVKKIMKT